MKEIGAIHFSPEGLMVLNAVLALVMFGIALELTKQDFINLWNNKKSALVGLVAHFVVLPLLTFLLVKILQPSPGVALGMILVGACPGGNMSNMFTHMAKGNTALAVGMTSISHILAIILTPFNFSFYGSLDEGTNAILKTIHISLYDVFITVGIVVLIPLAIGMLLNHYKPVLASKLNKVMKKFSLIAFAVFLIAAFASNAKVFIASIPFIMPVVILHNTLALGSGYLLASLFKLPFNDRKTITFETGVQNSGLGLILIFTFFGGMTEMAIVAASWGVWHLISGGTLAWWWGRRKSVSSPL
ncbi:MAG: bile acid:sodium symporter family protein [Bacteroidetes bacterium]|nr:bile acid:sodium symporter family protein [Bacteroidota bacterium]